MTEEFKRLLDRDFSRISVQPITKVSTPLLVELVNFASWAMRRCETETRSRGNPNEDVAAFVLFRHAIEMADAAQVLLEESCGTGAIPVVRSLFEASLGLGFLFQSSASYVSRSLSWLCVNLHHSIEARKTLEPGTAKGTQYIDTYEKEFGHILTTPKDRTPNPPIAAEIASLSAALSSPQLSPFEAEYQKLTGGMRYPNWFAFFSGPRNLAELASALGRSSEYKLLYSDWSSVAHAGNMSRYLGVSAGEETHDSMRRPEEVHQLALLTAVMLIRAIREMIGHFRNGEDLTGWYQREVTPLFHGLANLRVTIERHVER